MWDTPISDGLLRYREGWVGTNCDGVSPIGKIRCWIKYHGASVLVWSGEPALRLRRKRQPPTTPMK